MGRIVKVRTANPVKRDSKGKRAKKMERVRYGAGGMGEEGRG